MRTFSKLTIMVMVCSVFGCSHRNAGKPAVINPEILGQWASDDGCKLYLGKDDANQVFLLKFTNNNQVVFNNEPLKFYRESIMLKLKAKNSAVNFQGTFTEGMLMVDEYCKQPLYKVNNN